MTGNLGIPEGINQGTAWHCHIDFDLMFGVALAVFVGERRKVVKLVSCLQRAVDKPGVCCLQLIFQSQGKMLACHTVLPGTTQEKLKGHKKSQVSLACQYICM